MENGGEFDLSDADNTDEKISILAQRSAHNIRAGQHEQGIAELKEMLDLMDQDPKEDRAVIRANTYYKLAMTNQIIKNPEIAIDYWRRLYDMRNCISSDNLSDDDTVNLKGCIGTAAVEIADYIQNTASKEDPKPYITEAISLLEGNCDANNEWISLFRAYGNLAFCIDGIDPEEACRFYRKALM